MEKNLDRVIAIAGRVPGLAGARAAEAGVTRLGGMTNLVYRVEARDQTVIVRIPGEGTESYIDRGVEAHNAVAAHRAGVSPEVLWVDPVSGEMVTRGVPGIVTMTPDLFATRDGAAARAGRVLAELHRSGQEFHFRFELFAMIEEYLKVLSGRDVALPEGYHGVVEAAGDVRDGLAAHPEALAPCHCDPLCENFLDDGTRMWIVDWEYSGMNDPMWDLGDVAVEAGLDEAREAELLGGYFGRAPSGAERGRVVIYKAMCDLLWTLWGLIQLSDGNEAEDFRAYADTRFERCRRLMEDPAFAGHVAAVREG